MKIILTLTAAVIALGATPALAKPGGGHGDGGKQWSQSDEREDRGERIDYGYHGTSGRHCPPGLAKKHNGCMAPGQARQMARWSRGDRIPTGYGSYTPYNRIPQRYVDQYNLDPNNRYIYRDNSIYQVDPRTSVIQRILSGLVR